MPFIVLGLFGMFTLEFGIVGVLPAIITRFGVPVETAGLLMGVFALTVAACGPVSVLLSSRLDRKMVMVGAAAVFTVCSGLSAYIQDFQLLLALRIVAALCQPPFYAAALSSAIALYPPERQAYAMSRAVIGTTVGMVIGVPMMSWLAAAVSYESAFLGCAAVSLVAGLGLLLKLPKLPPKAPLSVGSQLSILRKPALWLNMLAATLVATALFSGFSYAAEYLKRQVGLADADVSLMLAIFGIGGVTANLLVGRLLDKHLVKAATTLPLVVCGIYLSIIFFASPWLPGMGLIALLWGGIHTCSAVTSQMWLRSVSREAPDFATSLYLTSANGGVMLGAVLGGQAIARFGMHGALGCGMVFALLASAIITTKALRYGRHDQRRAHVLATGPLQTGR